MIESGSGWAGKLQDRPSYILSWGKSQENPSLFYDLASLTKVIVTGSLLLELCLELKKTLEDFRSLTLDTFLAQAPAPLAKLTLGEVWDHRAGLKSHFSLDPLKSRLPFAGSRQELWVYILDQISQQGINDSKDCIYSDLDFWVLGALLETHYKKDLKELWQDYKKKYSLASNDLVYGPLKEDVVATETRHAAGVVNDDNACFMQGIAPHAGLFATAEAVWDWMLLMQFHYDKNPALQSYFVPQGDNRFWCGWDRPSEELSQAGEGAPRDEVLGHLGYTGTALWWDPVTRWGGLLLTNRVYPSHTDASREEIKALRVKFFTLLWHENRDELWTALQEIARLKS